MRRSSPRALRHGCGFLDVSTCSLMRGRDPSRFTPKLEHLHSLPQIPLEGNLYSLI